MPAWVSQCSANFGNNSEQLKAALSSGVDALQPGAAGTKGARSRGVAHVLGPGPHLTHLPTAVLFERLGQTLPALLSGRSSPEDLANDWHTRDGAFIGPAAQCSDAMRMLGITWDNPTQWSGGGETLTFNLSAECLNDALEQSVKTLMKRPVVKRILHNAREFLRYVVLTAEPDRRPKDFEGLERVWGRRIDIKAMTYAVMLARSGPSLMCACEWTQLFV